MAVCLHCGTSSNIRISPRAFTTIELHTLILIMFAKGSKICGIEGFLQNVYSEVNRKANLHQSSAKKEQVHWYITMYL